MRVLRAWFTSIDSLTPASATARTSNDMENTKNPQVTHGSPFAGRTVSPFAAMRHAGVSREMLRVCKDRRVMWMMIVADVEWSKQSRYSPFEDTGDFQERCHSLAAFQAAWINGSA